MLELLAALFLLLTVSMLLYVPIQAYLDKQYTLQLRVAAQELAADIRAAQQRSLFGNYTANRLIILSNKEGYNIEAQSKKIRFPEIGCNGVYFSQCAANYIGYANTGAPTKAGTYVLKHHKLAKKSITLTIQPSSGRVDINEQ